MKPKATSIWIIILLSSSHLSSCFSSKVPNANTNTNPSSSRPPSSTSDDVITLMSRAQSLVEERNVDEAFGTLLKINALNPNARGLPKLFESCLLLRVQLGEEANNDDDDNGLTLAQDRFGLASLFLDQERYEEASVQLHCIVASLSPLQTQTNNQKNNQDGGHLLDRASSMLFRTNGACCRWDTYIQDGNDLVSSLRLANRCSDSSSRNYNNVPVVHPFTSLQYPCISLESATQIASLYARRAVASAGPLAEETDTDPPSVLPVLRQCQEIISKRTHDIPQVTIVSRSTPISRKKKQIRLGYISPDFTGKHPLAFLMQDFFRHHDRDHFSVHLYSLSETDDSPEVRAIQEGSDTFTVLSPAGGGKHAASSLAERIQNDEIDMLVDLCGYTGTDLVAQIMSVRPAPIQISYMGFPGSTGAPYIDYMVCDSVVVPPFLRQYYTERLILMPHSYFVNSHKMYCSAKKLLVETKEAKQNLRQLYNLPKDEFVFCCHSRPNKIDPSTFRSWMRALVRVRQQQQQQQQDSGSDSGSDNICNKRAALWLLRSGSEMESNLRRIARNEFDLDDDDDALVFADICPRDEHLKRLGCADVFLDTPAYNAHTLGCDTLFAGVPMITLLQKCENGDKTNNSKNGNDMQAIVDTDKLPSRVGASLLLACGLEELICSTMQDYENLMVKCATDQIEWYAGLRSKLKDTRHTSPLFDTRRWVQNLELALRHIAASEGNSDATMNDMVVED